MFLGSSLLFVECMESGGKGREVNFRPVGMEVKRDRGEKSGGKALSFGSKNATLKCTTNALVLMMETEIAVYAARMRKGEG